MIQFIDLETMQGADLSGDLLVIPLFQEEEIPHFLKIGDLELCRAVRFNLEKEAFLGKEEQSMVMTTNGLHSIQKVMAIGLGRRRDLSALEVQEIGCRLVDHLPKDNRKKVLIYSGDFSGASLAYGILLKLWKFDKYLSRKEERCRIAILCPDLERQAQQFAYYQNLYEGIALARDLTSEPANILFPAAFAERCLLLQERGIEVEVLNKIQLEEWGLHALLSVGRGSENPPCIVTFRWRGGAEEERPMALVGKGVCYDSGGINLKESHQTEMKWDKAGAAAVVGTMLSLALNKVPKNVVGIVGLAENMPDGASLKPGDIIKTASGRTIEIVDTDNEGRLVLADCLWLAQQIFNPKAIVDLGTLTLETFGALAGEYAGLFCENDFLRNELIAYGEYTGEKLWSLPMGNAYARQLRSSVADLKNSGTPGFGESSAAAEFLKCFVESDIAWAHLDIAGTAWIQEETLFCRPGVTGFGVRLLSEWLTNSA